jgi:hypothetical protein
LGGRASPRAEASTHDAGLLAAGGDASPPICTSPRVGGCFGRARVPARRSIHPRRWSTRGWRGRQPSHMHVPAPGGILGGRASPRAETSTHDAGLLAAGGDASPYSSQSGLSTGGPPGRPGGALVVGPPVDNPPARVLRSTSMAEGVLGPVAAETASPVSRRPWEISRRRRDTRQVAIKRRATSTIL